MNALILAGGEGTRLRPLTIETPKPIVPIGNQPFLVRQILALKEAGIKNIALSLNYQPTKIVEMIGDGSRYGVNLIYIVEPAPMGTAGAYKFAANDSKETTLVLNGDILTDIDLLAVIDQHRNLKAEATIVLTSVDNPSAYGLVEFNQDFGVHRFIEKPTLEEIAKLNLNTINAGIYILEPTVLDLIPTDEKYSFEYQLFPALLANESPFFAFVAENYYWLDIGTPQRYLQANLDLIDGKIISSVEFDNNLIVGENSLIKKGANVSRSVIGDNVTIEENAVVENSVIWSNAKIGANTKIIDSVIGHNLEVGKNILIDGNYL